MQQLQVLYKTLEQQETVKHDMLVHPASLQMVGGNLVVTQKREGKRKEIVYEPTEHFHDQVAEKLSIPKAYYERMQVKGISLLDDSVNFWLHKEQKTRLIRTFETDESNIARAFLSNSYSIIDNLQVLTEALEAIKQTGLKVDIIAAELSETRMYLKVVCPEIEVKANEMLKYYGRAVGVDMGVISGFVLQNSEIGAGAFQIMPRGVVKVCMNGMVLAKDALRAVHLGAKLDAIDFSRNEAVKAANLKLIKEQVKHAVKVFLSKQYLTKLVNVFSELGSKEIAAPIPNVIQVVAKNYSLSDERKNSLLNYFIRQGDNRRIGVVNAITEECQTFNNPDLKHDSETMAFDILTNFNKIEMQAFKTKFTAN
jgi:hypothetical protein